MSNKTVNTKKDTDMMEDKEIQDRNALMGLHFHKIGMVEATHIDGNYECEVLKYHYDWNWLMPVVQRISGGISNRVFEVDYELLKDESDIKIMHLHIHASIETTYNEVVKFIKWHNKSEEK